MLSFLVRSFSRFYTLFAYRRRASGKTVEPNAFGRDTNYPFF